MTAAGMKYVYIDAVAGNGVNGLNIGAALVAGVK
jgi:hypothetical protein